MCVRGPTGGESPFGVELPFLCDFQQRGQSICICGTISACRGRIQTVVQPRESLQELRTTKPVSIYTNIRRVSMKADTEKQIMTMVLIPFSSCPDVSMAMAVSAVAVNMTLSR